MIIVNENDVLVIREGIRMMAASDDPSETIDLQVDGLLQNFGSIFTHTITSTNIIHGDGTIFAHKDSRPLSVEATQIVSYWPSPSITIPGYLAALALRRLEVA